MKIRNNVASRKARGLDLTSPDRQARYRSRKLNRQRAEKEIFLRALLQNFYEAEGILQPTWIESRLFFQSPHALGLEDLLSEYLPTSAVEVSQARTSSGQIKLIRPRYFLEKS
jgi:hypothetical protein